MPPDFLTPERKKIPFFGKSDSEKKYKKNFRVNNDNKIIRAWYLSSKRPVCRSIVNQTNGGASRTKLSTYNQLYNILRLFDVLPNFPLTTSETMGDYYL